MPLYEYKCDRCGVIFEVIQKFSDDPLKVHDNCGGDLERLISAAALQFKGTGWYVTDYGRNGKSSAPGNGSNGKSESQTAAKSETKAETKSETKSDSKTGQ